VREVQVRKDAGLDVRRKMIEKDDDAFLEEYYYSAPKRERPFRLWVLMQYFPDLVLRIGIPKQSTLEDFENGEGAEE